MVVTDYNEQFLDKRGVDHLIDELKAYIDGISTGSVDLSDYVTKSELQAKLDALDINIDLSSYATKEELTTAINSIDLSSYALKGEIPSLDGYATTEYVDNSIANIPSNETDLSNYYTKGEVYTKEETDAKIVEIEPITEDEIRALFTSEGLATETYVDNKIDSIPATDLTNYYTKDETYNKTEVDTLVANGSGSSSGGGSTGGASDTYSTEETAIGTWIDGSTIYRKVIEYGTLGSLSDSGGHGKAVVNFEEPFGIILKMTALLANSSGSVHHCVDASSDQVILVPSTSTSTYVKQVEDYKAWIISSTKTSVTLWYGKEFGGNNCTFIVEYTKSA